MLNLKIRDMKKLIFIWISFFVLLACSEKDDFTVSAFEDVRNEQSELYSWIDQNITTPYNVEVKYNWDGYEYDLGKDLVPVKKEKVQPFLKLFLKLFVKPYEEEVGHDFICKYIPKQLILLGSNVWNSDGSVNVGQAEGGRKIIISGVNSLNMEVYESLKEQFLTMHHEFGHILHQTKPYTRQFESVSKMYYTSTWFNYTDTQAALMGFVSAYALLSPNEDFVETLATLLVTPSSEWERITEDQPGDSEALKKGKSDLRKKVEIIASYMAETWNVDVYALQTRIADAFNHLKD